MTKQPLLVLVGPTAVGKTKLSLELAKAWNAEIISGDSMQVYRGMDIGTAKIPSDEMEGIPHHLIDVRNPDEPYSAADFQEACGRLIPEIAARGKLPFIVGGTGLYIESVCYGYQFSEAGSDEAFRAELQRLAEADGVDALHARLAAADPESAAKLHPNDVRRVIRALEIFHVTGETMSSQLAGQKKESPYELVVLGLQMDRAELYGRIEERIDLMMEAGLPEEVARLLEQGVPENAVAMQGLGYKELVPWLKGGTTKEEAVQLLKRDTRRFAKRQLSWFRHMKDIHWIDAGENFHNNLELIHAILAGKFAVDLEYTTNQSFLTGVTSNEQIH
ncbi:MULTISPECIES: tRNA (adenosine(37)-N6)-dimethylallyltransferase MiaA [unclassified Paenibacillus]|uniref:tRNA (adenosine(37)-N6)-dimethylallyltransferase MiaA n=1 Tax=unclassified Paenibacillus TaxID=185978 RepID=UPI000956881A|nr:MULTISPECIES: tRNA (adenosine(37)-N6)-dimethylallyltransferase MiaA [unclassified Paenibacillus]ASS65253.1 tRNA (adenosine(37)-N6)-dimethylallyltransferase MiaA [Paenibacillus sp. RUD330]SIQ42598.1 tRNA dimethylallyltransferase [Paenibacillus sp. RU4X]SIQ64814.1 tRNA dimethylallyltransferase [Paenibacillus sp. RU4T]